MMVMVLSERLDEVRNDLERFIADKDIDAKRVSEYSEIIETAHEEKLAWALSQKFEPVKSLQIYDSYKLIYDSLSNIKILLLDAKRRHENPTTAEIILPYINKLTLFTKKLEVELKIEENNIDFNSIEDKTDTLRKEAILKNIIKAVEEVDYKFYKQIHETALEAIKSDT